VDKSRNGRQESVKTTALSQDRGRRKMVLEKENRRLDFHLPQAKGEKKTYRVGKEPEKGREISQQNIEDNEKIEGYIQGYKKKIVRWQDR